MQTLEILSVHFKASHERLVPLLNRCRLLLPPRSLLTSTHGLNTLVLHVYPRACELQGRRRVQLWQGRSAGMRVHLSRASSQHEWLPDVCRCYLTLKRAEGLNSPLSSSCQRFYGVEETVCCARWCRRRQADPPSAYAAVSATERVHKHPVEKLTRIGQAQMHLDGLHTREGLRLRSDGLRGNWRRMTVQHTSISFRSLGLRLRTAKSTVHKDGTPPSVYDDKTPEATARAAADQMQQAPRKL